MRELPNQPSLRTPSDYRLPAIAATVATTAATAITATAPAAAAATTAAAATAAATATEAAATAAEAAATAAEAAATESAATAALTLARDVDIDGSAIDRRAIELVNRALRGLRVSVLHKPKSATLPRHAVEHDGGRHELPDLSEGFSQLIFPDGKGKTSNKQLCTHCASINYSGCADGSFSVQHSALCFTYAPNRWWQPGLRARGSGSKRANLGTGLDVFSIDGAAGRYLP